MLLDVDLNVIHPHLLTVRKEAYDIIGEEYVFIRPYRVGHTLDGKLIVVVVDVQVRGGCHIIDDEGKIDGSGKGTLVRCAVPQRGTCSIRGRSRGRGSKTQSSYS